MRCHKCGAELEIVPVVERKHFDGATIRRWVFELLLFWPLGLAVILINLYKGKKTVMYAVCPSCGYRREVQ